MFKNNPNLRDIYSQIQENTKDFRENIFIKNLDIIENGYEETDHTNKELENKHHNDMLKGIKKGDMDTPDLLLKKFTLQAQNSPVKERASPSKKK